MIKYCLEKWEENKEKLKNRLSKDLHLNSCDYKYLVELTTLYILGDEWDASKITEIDDGSYQGTLLYLIPKNTYNPSENEYLMTYVDYGSCSYCDTLQGIKECPGDIITDEQVKDFMTLCKDIVTNMISPYNRRYDHLFDTIDKEKNYEKRN